MCNVAMHAMSSFQWNVQELFSYCMEQQGIDRVNFVVILSEPLHYWAVWWIWLLLTSVHATHSHTRNTLASDGACHETLISRHFHSSKFR